MTMFSPVEAVSDSRRVKLGFYALVPGKYNAGSVSTGLSDDTDYEFRLHNLLEDARTLSSLTQADLDGIRCIIVDIRQNARQALIACRDAASSCPIIALADADQTFPADYPFGTFVADVTNTYELGRSVFWHRVDRAVGYYEKPLSVNDTNSPVYSVFKSIADQTSDWIIIKDLQHRFVVAGEHFAATAGTPLEKIIGRDDLEIGSSKDAVLGNPETGKIGFWAQDEAVTNSAQATVEENPEWLLYSRKARYRRTYRVPLKNPAGDVFALLVCSQDITEQIRNEQLLTERTHMLEQVTDEKKLAEESRKIAENAVAAKTRFLAAASHDLRQPLHAMGLFLNSLEKRIEGQEELLLVQQIKLSCSALGNLFNSCLDISRLDAGVVERNLEHVSAGGFLESLHDEFRLQAKEKSLDYRFFVDDSIMYSDQMLLARIVRNLLNNAIQNTDTGYVSIECREAASFIEMRVTDTGRGIAPEDVDRVFDEFHQIDSSNARHGRGLGLGLSIVKRLSKLLDISITLDSRLGEGSQFTLMIPAGQLCDDCGKRHKNAVTMPEELTVLIVEDDRAIRFGMEALLESYGCKTLCAEDADSAIQLLKANTTVVPDIIVVDYHISMDQTGIQALVALRTFLNVNVPAILVTGDTSHDSERDASIYKLPVLHKPVDADDLLATINKEVHLVRH